MRTVQAFVEDLELVRDDLIGLMLDHELWLGLNDNLRANPHAGTPGEAMEFITRSHFTALGIGLRRQIDEDASSVSLARLLADVAGRRIVFRRSEHVALFTKDRPPAHHEHMLEQGELCFSELCGSADAALYPPQKAFRHLTWLRHRAEPMRHFVNKSIAHRSRKVPDALTIRYHQRLLWCMQKLWHHYYLLATAIDGSLDPGMLGEQWREAFRRPWMPAPEADAR